MKRALIIGGAVLGLLAMGAGFSYLWFLHRVRSPADPSVGDVEIIIDQGSSFDHAVEVMAYHGLVRDPLLFDLRARQRGKRVALKAGLYRFHGRMNADELMDTLAAGPKTPLDALPLVFQVIPGSNIWQVDARLRSLGVAGDLLAMARDHKRVAALGLPTPRALPRSVHTLLEGYLFPESYHLLRKRPSLERAVRLATGQFRKVYAKLSIAHKGSLARLRKEHRLSVHEVVILASLVEKEVAVLAEAPMVAGVFYNRLRKGMKLMTDPTMVYGPDTWRKVPSPRFRKDHRHPYNTYHLPGLPPGPICNPGRNSLAAAMAPAKTDALYFVAMRDGTGRHAFAKTYAEHKKNIERYLK